MCFTVKGRKGRTTTLRVIQGGLIDETSIGPLRIVAAPTKAPPFHVDAFALEEDTFLVLSADAQVRDPKVPLTRIMTRLVDTKPATPGSVLVRGRRPLRFLAVVHDLNQEPSWKEEWVADCLEKIFAEAESRELKSIALPFLGTLHGRLERGRFLGLLGHALSQTVLTHLESLWLVVPDGMNSKILEILKSGTQG